MKREHLSYAVLSKVSLFASLAEAELQAIRSQALIKTFPRNALLLNEGDPTDSLYVIINGRVRVYCSDEEGNEIVLDEFGPLDYFGELALIDHEPRSASVMTLEPSRLAIIHRKDFLHYLSHHPNIAINLLKTLVSKLRRETESVKSLALMDVYGRVAKLLLDLAEEREGQLRVERLTYREIGSRVGASREMVGRIFKDLKQGGYITFEKNEIILNESLPARW